MAAHMPSSDPSGSQPWCGSESLVGLSKRQVSEIFIKFPPHYPNAGSLDCRQPLTILNHTVMNIFIEIFMRGLNYFLGWNPGRGFPQSKDPRTREPLL